MGLAVGYQVEAISPFVESLFSDGAFLGEVVLFIKPDDRILEKYLESRGVRYLPFRAENYPVASICVARWFAYQEYLRRHLAENGTEFRNIMICDVRDAIFQTPLFEVQAKELEFHFEADQPRIGACQYNSNWVKNCFGDAELARLADKRIVCSGTVSGRQQGILNYIDIMTKLSLDLPEEAQEMFGVDQGLHNYIVYNALAPDMTILDNFERVATLHYVDGASLRADERGRVVNPDGSISEMSHQWDRHPHLVDAITAIARQRQLANSLCGQPGITQQ